MIRAEAVVSCALGAIAELQFRVAHIRAAAYGTLVPIRLGRILPLLMADGVVETRRLTGLPPAEAEETADLRPEENDEVQKSGNRQDGIVPRTAYEIADDFIGKERKVDIRQHAHPDGDDEEQKHLRIRIEQRKSKKHGEVYVRCAVNGEGGAEKQADERHGDDAQYHTADVIGGELCRTQVPLQRAADPVIEIAGQQQRQRAEGLRDQHERYQAPDLPVQYTAERKGERMEKLCALAGELREQKDRYVADHDIKHQVWDTKVGVPDAEAFDGRVQLIQDVSPLAK